MIFSHLIMQLQGAGTAIAGSQSVLRRSNKLINISETFGYSSATAGVLGMVGSVAFPVGAVADLKLTTPTINNALRPDGGNYSNSITEPLYLDVSATGTAAPGGTAAQLNYNYNIPLSQFSETVFSLDKVLYMNEILVLRIVFDSLAKVSYFGTSATDPTTGAAANTTNISVTGLQVYLAVEQDPLII